MSVIAQEFIHNWHEAVEKRSFDKVDALLADDMTLTSPVAYRPFTDRTYIMKVLENVVTVLTDFRYTRSTVLSDGGVMMIFEGEIDGKTIEGIDLFDLDSEGRVTSLKVMLRPFKLYTKFAFIMAERLGVMTFKMKILKLLIG